jgi:hypothetical protein
VSLIAFESFILFNLVLILHLILAPAKQRDSFWMIGAAKQPGGYCGSGVHEIDTKYVGAL